MAGAYFSREGVWRRSLLDVAILGGAAGLGGVLPESVELYFVGLVSLVLPAGYAFWAGVSRSRLVGPADVPGGHGNRGIPVAVAALAGLVALVALNGVVASAAFALPEGERFLFPFTILLWAVTLAALTKGVLATSAMVIGGHRGFGAWTAALEANRRVESRGQLVLVGLAHSVALGMAWGSGQLAWGTDGSAGRVALAVGLGTAAGLLLGWLRVPTSRLWLAHGVPAMPRAVAVPIAQPPTQPPGPPSEEPNG